MKLQRETDYALRTLLYLAERALAVGAAEYVPLKEVTENTGISGSQLDAVGGQLVERGDISVVMKPRAGIRLERSPDDINLGEIIAHFEGQLDFRSPEIAKAKTTPGTSKLMGMLDQASRELECIFAQYTLAQMLPRPASAASAPPSRDREPTQPTDGDARRRHLRLLPTP
jgi:Rrf2 family transcriptional regulator, nitric oxide-sensitive transcriptional repressor